MGFELFQELLLTAVIPVFFAFLIGKISPGGHGEGERSEDTLASSCVPNSREMLRRQPDEELQNADDFGTGEQLRGSEGETAAAEERGGGIDLVLESVEEKRKPADQVGEKDAKISEEIPEQDVIERYNAEDLKKEEEKEEKEAESSSSDVKTVRVQGTEIGSRRDEVSTEIKSGSLLHGEDEWEGIETTELEKRFRLVAEYFSSPPGSEALDWLSSYAQLELYGLHKIATEGPCYRSHPLSLKSSTRARWHAWAKLGRMTPETAMEQYISLLSKSIPGWVLENYGNEILNTRHPDMGSSLQNQLSPSVAL